MAHEHGHDYGGIGYGFGCGAGYGFGAGSGDGYGVGGVYETGGGFGGVGIVIGRVGEMHSIAYWRANWRKIASENDVEVDCDFDAILDRAEGRQHGA
jgi:hypothetical protein